MSALFTVTQGSTAFAVNGAPIKSIVVESVAVYITGGGGGAGTITSVNTQTGPAVVLVAADVGAASTGALTTETARAVAAENAVAANLSTETTARVAADTAEASTRAALAASLTVFATAPSGSSGQVLLGDGTLTTLSGAVAAAGALIAGNNLSDVTNPAVARKNLGLAPQAFEVPGLATYTWQPNVKAVATANVASLSGVATPIDGVTLVAHTATAPFYVLLTNQTTTTDDGYWQINSGAWTRPSWYATGALITNPKTYVTGGTVATANGVSQYWSCQQARINVGTDSPTFTQEPARALLPVGIDPAGPITVQATTQANHLTGTTVTSGSGTVLDPAIAATDLGKPLDGNSAGGGGVTGLYVGTVTPGVSFQLWATPTGTPTTAYASSTGGFRVGSEQNSYPGFCICADGTMLIVYQSRISDSAGTYSRIMGIKSADGGRTWGAPYVIYQPPAGSTFGGGMGALKVMSDGTIVAVGGKGTTAASGGVLYVYVSPPGGNGAQGTWNGPITVATGLTGGSHHGVGPVIETGPGQFVVPYYGENTGDAFDSVWLVSGTLNAGRTAVSSWGTPQIVANGVADSLDYNECCIVKLNNGLYFMIIRVASVSLYQCTSPDLVNWTAPTLTGIASTNGAPNLCQTDSGALTLLYRSTSGNVIATSYNNGETWSPQAILPVATGFPAATGRYGQIYQVAPNQIGAVFSMQCSTPSSVNLYFDFLYDGVGVTSMGTPVVEPKNLSDVSRPGIIGSAGTWATVSAPATAGILWGGQLIAPTTVNSHGDFMVLLEKGTYNITITRATAANYGIVTWMLDGITLGTVDGYNASTVYNGTTTYSSVNVPISGWHLLEGIILSKNASSSNFSAGLQHIRFNRTDNNL